MTFILDVPTDCVVDTHGFDVSRYATTKQKLSAFRCCQQWDARVDR